LVKVGSVIDLVFVAHICGDLTEYSRCLHRGKGINQDSLTTEDVFIQSDGGKSKNTEKVRQMDGGAVRVWIRLGRNAGSVTCDVSGRGNNSGIGAYRVQFITPASPGARIGGFGLGILPLSEEAFCGRPVEPFGIVHAFFLEPRIHGMDEGFQGRNMAPRPGTG
jgi:hypothetical protein